MKQDSASEAHTHDHQHDWLDAATARRLDEAMTSWLARPSGGLPLPRIVMAYLDWLANLSMSPGRQLLLLQKLTRGRLQLLLAVIRRIEPPPGARYAGEGWKRKPFAWLAQAAAQQEALAELATHGLPGVGRHNAALVQFYTRQAMELMSPANWPLTNPEVWSATRRERGRNLLRGARHALQDLSQMLRGKAEAPAHYRVGENLATTPGKVVLRNELMELIQYAPTTPTVHPEPVLIVPAWIMKYYILDLSPQNSLVRWLVAQGHTVFMISWKNPDERDRERGMDDYRRLGVLAALEAIASIRPQPRVHACGYCVGGTLMAITAAAMARDGDQRLASVTLLAAQTDFEDAGELKLFIDEMTLHWLDQRMARKGYLDTTQMAAAFHLLRSRDLVWSRLLREYWLGERAGGIDIMAWNADGTRMPQRMHSDYLRQLYLENRLAQGRYEVEGRAVSVGDIRVPLFAVGTVTDHVAPWKSVYKIRQLKRLGESSFVLTNGGHNAGIVSEPGRARRYYHLGGWDEASRWQSPEDWEAAAERREGSWWPAWQEWLARHSGAPVKPPRMGNTAQGFGVLRDAPGTYVHQQ